jgi:hypothetical protein
MSTDAYTSRPVERAAEEVREGLAVAALAVAVCSYAEFAVHARFDAGMTGDVLPVLWSVVPEAERAAYPGRLEAFVDAHREQLRRLYAEYGPQSATAKHGRHEPLVRKDPLHCPASGGHRGLPPLARRGRSGSPPPERGARVTSARAERTSPVSRSSTCRTGYLRSCGEDIGSG